MTNILKLECEHGKLLYVQYLVLGSPILTFDPFVECHCKSKCEGEYHKLTEGAMWTWPERKTRPQDQLLSTGTCECGELEPGAPLWKGGDKPPCKACERLKVNLVQDDTVKWLINRHHTCGK